MQGLHGEGVEAAVYYGDGAGDERGGVGNQILDGAAQFLGLAEALERRLAYHVLAALRQAAVGIGEQRSVLIGQEEARCYGVDAYTRGELSCHFVGQERREIADAGLGGCVTAHSRHRTERCHRREIDYGSLAGLHHRFQEYLRGNDGADKVEVKDS